MNTITLNKYYRDEKIQFNNEELDLSNAEEIQDEVVEIGRWTSTKQLVFKQGDRFYAFCYTEGLTEYQEGTDEDDEVDLYEVEPFEKTIIEYKVKKENK